MTLQIALWALHWCKSTDPFVAPSGFPAKLFNQRSPAVLGWVALIGHDADTYGATAGPLIAAATRGLPSSMTRNLEILRRFDEEFPPPKAGKRK